MVLGEAVIVGKHTYGEIIVKGKGNVVIGKFCSIAKGARIVFRDNHKTEWITTFPFRKRWEMLEIPTQNTKPEDVVIENDVWIGTGVMILGGAHIRSGACIGAYSVVAGQVPPYCVAAGNPTKPIRYRFTQEVIDKLLKVQWWDLPDEKIRKFAPLLSSNRMEEFLCAISQS